ncbi:FKBP-type peptidyl-prolyl cis-trans isomerase [Congregibacter sp.]|uniref:FKBP-type peptidyl-prolyl cis-trans isomerase n=1 Tax=Congregibacter sp. TaxID=2744308 RepID=UPI003F6B99A7
MADAVSDSMDGNVGEGTRVFLNFSLALEDGAEVDSNFGGEAVSFAIGDGSLLPGFERHIIGMQAGERKLFQVPPEDAFGQPNENNVQRVPREGFDEEMELELGLVCSFADASGGELPGMIVGFDDSEVTVDFNHPLAGQTILFDVQIHRLEAVDLH